MSGVKFSAVTFGIGTGTGQMSEEESGMDNVASGVNGIGCIGLMKWRLGLTKVEGLTFGSESIEDKLVDEDSNGPCYFSWLLTQFLGELVLLNDRRASGYTPTFP